MVGIFNVGPCGGVNPMGGALEVACGNGTMDAGEACDDGNATSGVGCDDDVVNGGNCTVAACGNGAATAGEDCDDANTTSGDCCSSICQFEVTGSACPDDGNPWTDEECEGTGGCEHASNTAPCDDGDRCTVGDACAGGAYQPGVADGDANGVCDVMDTCTGGPEASNADQLDSDGDCPSTAANASGDACDECPARSDNLCRWRLRIRRRELRRHVYRGYLRAPRHALCRGYGLPHEGALL